MSFSIKYNQINRKRKVGNIDLRLEPDHDVLYFCQEQLLLRLNACLEN